ncbi:MAG: fibronectin type III domain-containing protein [Lewinellaceae bacterium]|nr:fibronectin type III domain-containing protein [Lewinellaceae bacterium]
MNIRNTPFILILLLSARTLLLAGNPEHPVPGCSEPAGFAWTAVTHESVTVRWDSAAAGTVRFELVAIKKGASTKLAFKNPARVDTGNTHTFGGLDINTAYDLFIRRVCQSAIPGDLDYSDWVRISAKTAAAVPMDCSFDTTLVAISQVTHERFNLNLSPPRKLSPNGRRLLLRYRLTAVPPGYNPPTILGQWQERLISDENKLYVDHLYQGGTYDVYVKQLRDGSYMEYTRACKEVGPLQVVIASRERDCDYAQNVTLSCTGADFVTLHF